MECPGQKLVHCIVHNFIGVVIRGLCIQSGRNKKNGERYIVCNKRPVEEILASLISNSSASRILEEVREIKDFICHRRQLKCYRRVELPAPISQEVTPTSQEAPPTSQEAPPTSQEAPPTSQETPPTSQETPPTSQEAPPTSQEAPPTSQEAPPTSQEAPPTSQEAPPTSQEAPPTSQEAPPTSQEAPPTSQNNSESDAFLPIDGSPSENTRQELSGASSRGSTPPPTYTESMRIIELESGSNPVSSIGNYLQFDAEFIKRMLKRSAESGGSTQSTFSKDFQEQRPVMSYLNFVSPQNFEMRSLDGTGAGPSNSQSAGTSTDPRN